MMIVDPYRFGSAAGACVNGPTWSAITSGSTLTLDGRFNICWTGDRFIAFGYSGSAIQLRSSFDVSSWTDLPNVTASARTGSFNSGAMMSNGLGLVLRLQTSNQMLRSTDFGATWATYIPAISIPNSIGYQSYVDGKFWFLSQTSLTSTTNGTTFVIPTLPALGTLNLQGVAGNGSGTIVITCGPAGFTANSGRVLVSTDGGSTFTLDSRPQPWGSASLSPAKIVRGISGRWVGVPTGGSGQAYYSDNLLDWFLCSNSVSPGGNLEDLIFADGVWVAITLGPSPFVSVDGAFFVRAPSPSNAIPDGPGGSRNLAYGNGIYAIKSSNTNSVYYKGEC